MTLLHEESTHYWRGWLIAAGAPEIDWSKGPIFHETTVVQEAVVRGEGVALGDSVLWSELLEDGRAIRLFDVAIEYDSYDLLVPHSALGDPAVAAFRAWLLDEAKQTHPV
jgi:LysR family glycine cleavage system transcriptional activator